MMDTIIAEAWKAVGNRWPQDGIFFGEKPALAVVYDKGDLIWRKQIYRPVLCLVLQGRKELRLGSRVYEMSAGQSLVVSHELPVTSCIVEACEEKPYVALAIELDMAIVRSLYDEIGDALPATGASNSIDVGQADAALMEAMHRLLCLFANPTDAAVLEPLIRREIHYRLLMASHGGMLRELLRIDSHAGRIARAMRHIQNRFDEPLAVPKLAELSAMSVSTFHEHFKAVTGSSPLQYQKALRLLEARRCLVESGESISGIAFRVGYESPTQFSREFARQFGLTPREARRGSTPSTVLAA